ncbi:MAG: hypothetical protein LRY55_11590 [Leadbetterella sp.]|nr:hypothetical protein [Leadbetterella sp.]
MRIYVDDTKKAALRRHKEFNSVEEAVARVLELPLNFPAHIVETVTRQGLRQLDNGKYQWKPFLVTVVSVVIFDLLVGVGVGLAYSVYYILKGNFKNAFFYARPEDGSSEPLRMVLSEEVSFLNKANIKESLEAIPKNSSIVIDASNSSYIDFDVLQGIKEFVDYKSKYRNIQCELIGFDKQFSLSEVPASSH